MTATHENQTASSSAANYTSDFCIAVQRCRARGRCHADRAFCAIEIDTVVKRYVSIERRTKVVSTHCQESERAGIKETRGGAFAQGSPDQNRIGCPNSPGRCTVAATESTITGDLDLIITIT